MRSGVTGVLLDITSRSRLIRGINLFLRSQSDRGEQLAGAPLGPDGKPMRSQVMNQGYPLAVPLADAEENIVQIAELAQQNNAQVLLVTQLIPATAFKIFIVLESREQLSPSLQCSSSGSNSSSSATVF